MEIAVPAASATHQEERAPERLSLKEMAAYASGGMVDPIFLGNVIQFLYPFYNVILGLPGTYIGFLVAIPRLWDAVSDPLVGQWSDNCRSRWGRRRPFMVVGIVGLAATFLLFWVSPFAPGNVWGHGAWLLIVSLLMYTFYTFFAIPYGALGFEISIDYDERTRLMGMKTAAAQVGEMVRMSAVYVGLLMLAYTPWAGQERHAYVVGNLPLALLFLGGGLVAALCVRERYGQAGAVGMSLFRGAVTTLRSPLYRRLVAMQVFYLIGLYFYGTTMVYLVLFYMKDPQLLLVAPVVNAFVVVAAIVMWNRVTPRIGKVWTLRLGMICLMMTSVLAYYAFVPDQWWRVIMLSLLWGPGWASFQVANPAIVADLTDVDELETGKRREGSYASVIAFIAKLAATVAGVMIGVILDAFVRFNPELGADQPEETWWRMRVYTAVLPTLCTGLALLMLTRFALTKQRMEEVRRLLNNRRDANRPGEPTGAM